jgi:predicted enzyme related to lactoylglutathione lyase
LAPFFILEEEMKMTALGFLIVSAVIGASFVCGMMVQAKRQTPIQVSEPRVTGIGGVFFKARDPLKLADWYRKHLGISFEGEGPAFHSFEWTEKENPSKTGATAWAIFPETTKYLGQEKSQFMINYRVANLERLLTELKKEGVEVDKKIQDEANGRFSWVTDPEGNRVELWEPK